MPVAEVEEVAGRSSPEPERRDLGRGWGAAAEATSRGCAALRVRSPPRGDRRRAGLLARGRPAKPARGNQATEEGADMKAAARPPHRARDRGGPARRRLHDGRLPVRAAAARASAEGLVRIGLPNQDAEELLADLAERVSPRVLEAPAQLDEVRRELDLYFGGKLERFDLPIDWQLSEGFRLRVLRAIARIPYGETRSYTRDGDQRRQRAGGTSGGDRLRAQPDPACRSLSPGAAHRRRPRRLRRWPADEGRPARARGHPGARTNVRHADVAVAQATSRPTTDSGAAMSPV